MDSGVLFNWSLNLTFVNNMIVREASLEDAIAIAPATAAIQPLLSIIAKCSAFKSP